MIRLDPRLRAVLLGGVLVGGIVVVLFWPVTTRFGVDYHWSSKKITLGEKAVEFISRDLQTRRLTAEVTSGAATKEERLLRILEWTTAHIHATPKGFPIVDDHVLYIIIRGYGAADQQTEVFALLASYAGFTSTAVRLSAPGTDRGLIVAAVRDGSRTYLFDVVHHLSFRNAHGEFADLSELVNDPQIIAQSAGPLVLGGVPYEQYFRGLNGLHVSFSRMEAQKPWPRLWQEIGHRLGFGAGQITK